MSKIHSTYCMSPQDGTTIDFAEAGETKGMHLTHDGESSIRQGVELHITVEKTVQYDIEGGESGSSPEALPTSESKHAEV